MTHDVVIVDRLAPRSLLDAGCGPGILTTRLASYFDEVVGLDPDADMLAEGRAFASASGITNIEWVQARAEDLPAAAPGPSPSSCAAASASAHP